MKLELSETRRWPILVLRRKPKKTHYRVLTITNQMIEELQFDREKLIADEGPLETLNLKQKRKYDYCISLTISPYQTWGLRISSIIGQIMQLTLVLTPCPCCWGT